MGVPKHHKESARAKACKLYSSENRLEKNKARRKEIVESGKKCPSHRKPKTRLQKLNIWVENAVKRYPYTDKSGIVHWGVLDEHKTKKNG